jgi:glycosyltransferase involved in cell wall biosynthesis
LLIFVDWFLPGYKAGGQIQSCANLTFALKDDINVYVVTRDRDLGDIEPYHSIVPDTWQQLDKRLQVLYVSPQRVSYKNLLKVVGEVKPDCIYLNSMFSFQFTILPLIVAIRSRIKSKTVLAPRGMLHKGALQYKNFKKRTFLTAFKRLGLHKKITFHVTDAVEYADARAIFGKKVQIEQINDFPNFSQPPLQIIEKKQGHLSCLFVSRISPKKNLLYFLSVLENMRETVFFTIAGPVESEKYWQECKIKIDSLPSNITVKYIGAIPNQSLSDIYKQHHVFVLPTFGENFGHVIFESLANGRPVLISDQTPWRNLQDSKAGWDLSLDNRAGFLKVLQQTAQWNQADFDASCKTSWQFASNYISSSSLKKDYIRLFNS